MSIRKEQVLLVVVALLAVWIAEPYLEVKPLMTRVRTKTLEYEPVPFERAALAEAEVPQVVRRDSFHEPSETRPLPPRELMFPPRQPLTLAGVPLEPGPDPRHSWLLSRDGALVEGVVLGSGGDEGAAGDGDTGDGAEAAAADDGSVPVQGGNATGRLSREQAARIYDRVWIQHLSEPYFCRIEPADGVDLFALEEQSDLSGVTLRLRMFDLKKNELGRLQSFGGEKGQELVRVQLADNVRNAVDRRLRLIADAGQGQRLEAIDWLLEVARSEPWVRDIARQQAEVYMQAAGGAIEGRRVLQRVLRAQGDIAGEFELLRSTSGDVLADAFRLRGLGHLEAQLGLWADAEQHLREAVATQPNDARNHGALARFLLRRGRSQQALAAANDAERTLGTVVDADERAGIQRTILSCLLAVGELDSARTLATALGEPYLRGAVAYAAGELEGALQAFRLVSDGRDRGAAALGVAVCLLEQGSYAEAHDALQQVAEDHPLLRHRALSALALLFSRIGRFDAAISNCDRALEAAPGDPYTLYVRGRTQRLMGQAAAAAETLAEALRERDDFGHAIAEMATVQAQLAGELQGEAQAAALIAARRYLDRAVALAAEPRLELLQLQGLYRFAAADWRAARDAFLRAEGLAEAAEAKAFGRGAVAVVDYSRGRVLDAEEALERLERDLGRTTELGGWAERTLKAIEDHARKEALGDSFDRDQLGQIWDQQQDGTLQPRLHDNQLVLRGELRRGGPGLVYAARANAVPHAKNFLACKATVELGPQHDQGESFAGLGIAIEARSEVQMSARVGLFEGAPFVVVIDGKEDGRPRQQRKPLDPTLLRVGKPQELELRVVERGEQQGNRRNLVVYFNGVLAYSHELEQLNGGTRTELKTMLFAEGRRGAQVDVRFDDFELERSREQ